METTNNDLPREEEQTTATQTNTTRKMKKRTWIILAALAAIVLWAVKAYNGMVTAEEGVKTAWGNVETVYQRRADLIGNLVATVQGAANYEKGTLTEVIEMRSKASSVQVDPTKLDQASLANFQQAQDALGSALQRGINVVVERYPELTATKNFQDLQAQIEGTENRISVERKKFNETAQGFNTLIRRFPKSVLASLFGFEAKAYFTAAEGADKAPEVNFEF